MGKMPTKYIEKMYHNIFLDGKWKSEITQTTAYYGYRGVIWSMFRDLDGCVYLKHYDTIILRDNLRGEYTILGGWSATDQNAINSYLLLSGDYPQIKCRRNGEELSLEY